MAFLVLALGSSAFTPGGIGCNASLSGLSADHANVSTPSSFYGMGDDDWSSDLTFGEAAAHWRRLNSASPTSREHKEWARQRRELEAQRTRIDAVRAANKKTFKAHKMDPERLRIGICVIGQAERLDLTSKIRHIVAANSGKHHVDLVMALAPRGDAHFVNEKTDAGGRKPWTPPRIRAKIGNALRGGKLIIDFKPQEEVPFLRSVYVTQNDKYAGDRAKKDERARSHVRQWGALWQCHMHFTYAAKANGAPYDMFIKLRDDSYVMRDWLFENPAHWKGSVVVKQCNAFQGLNDKTAVLDAKYGEAFFARPLLDWYFSDFFGVASEVRFRNPESYLLGVMKHHAVHIKRVPPASMPTITSRVDAEGKMCIPMDRTKLGYHAMCVPVDCKIRATLYCKRCDGGIYPQTQHLINNCRSQIRCS